VSGEAAERAAEALFSRTSSSLWSRLERLKPLEEA
jgi:hypothetical protein